MAVRTSIVLRTSKSPVSSSVRPSWTISIAPSPAPRAPLGLTGGSSSASVLRKPEPPALVSHEQRPTTTMTREHPPSVAPRPRHFLLTPTNLVPMVNLTRIYTRTGDGGTTRLGDMSETSKNDLRLHAYADVDEANAQLGVALAHDLEEPVRVVLIHAQNDLFDVGADFCTPVVTPDPGVPAAADHRGLRRPARGVVRRVQRRPAEAPLVHPVRGAPPPRPGCTSRAPSYDVPSGRRGRPTTCTPRP